MASAMRDIARRFSGSIVKSATPEAWETTAQLRSQYIVTSMDAMPARVEAASKELAELRARVTSGELTVNDLTTGFLRAGEMYAFYLLGKTIGGGSL